MDKIFRFRHLTRGMVRHTDVIVYSFADIERLVSEYDRRVKVLYVSPKDLWLKYKPVNVPHVPAYPVYYVSRKGQRRYVGITNFLNNRRDNG